MADSSKLALPVGVLAIIYGLFSILLRRGYPVPPQGNKAIVIVSGASTGIGRHAVEHLAKLGFTVLAGVRKQEDVVSLRDASLPNVQPVILDVTKEADIQAVVAKAVAMGLPVWGLVNNAGLGYPIPVELAELSRVRKVFEVNVMAIIAMTKAFTPLLRKAKGGRIINVGSATGTMATQCDGIYAASKHAVEGLTDSMRLELAAWDMSVSLVVPGQVQSSMWGKLTGSNAPAEKELTKEQYELYKPLFLQVDKAITGFLSTLAPPSVTSAAIAHALTSKHPKTRYLVAGLNGAPLWLVRGLVGLLPDRLVDVIKLNL